MKNKSAEKHTKKNIVVAGGGFGGLNAAVLLAQKLSGHPEAAKITMIDRNDYHLYYQNLYEVASSDEEFTSIADLKHSVALPYKAALPKSVEFVRAEINKINQDAGTVTAGGREINFDYLVVSLGAAVEYFNIPGLDEDSLTLKSLEGALKIRGEFEALVEQYRLDEDKRILRIVLGGGGAIGIELAGELQNLKQILSWKYGYPLEKIETLVVEGAPHLLPGLPLKVGQTAQRRLHAIGVETRLESLITAVNPQHVVLNNGEIINYDMLIWTGGVRSVDIPFVQKVETDKKHRCMTERNLELRAYPNIYMIGDNACIMSGDGTHAVPQTATQAIDHAKYVSSAIAAKILGWRVPDYRPKGKPFATPIKGKWAILYLPNGFMLTGFWAWVLKQFAQVRYLWGLMPLSKAVRETFFEEQLYSRND
ncbi:FAD-dependent oxidoreductase [Patescibacteria group bacterium]|nr:FAD-dependent oxidoreductase [Patescibacteria group bacterium]